MVLSTFIGVSLVKGSFLDRTRCTIAAHSFFFVINSVSRPRLEYSVNLRLKYSYEVDYREGYGLLFYLIKNLQHARICVAKISLLVTILLL